MRSSHMRETEDLYPRKLVIADRHIEDGKRLTAEQRLRIMRMQNSGLDTWEAERLLREFEQILLEMSRHRQMIVDRMQGAA